MLKSVQFFFFFSRQSYEEFQLTKHTSCQAQGHSLKETLQLFAENYTEYTGQRECRCCKDSAHLQIPGFRFTPRGRFATHGSLASGQESAIGLLGRVSSTVGIAKLHRSAKNCPNSLISIITKVVYEELHKLVKKQNSPTSLITEQDLESDQKTFK